MSKTSPEEYPVQSESSSPSPLPFPIRTTSDASPLYSPVPTSSHSHPQRDSTALPMMDDDDFDHSPMLPKSKKPKKRWDRLRICLVVIGLSCVAVIAVIFTVFFVFFEACLNPYTTSWNNITYFTEATTTITFAANVSRSLTLRSLPTVANPNRVDTNVVARASSPEGLGAITTINEIGPNSYSLSFVRPPVFQSLEVCTTEDVTFSFSPTFDQKLNGTFFVESGLVDIQPTHLIRFDSVMVNIENGPITASTISCENAIHLETGTGDVRVASSTSKSLYIFTGAGVVTLNGPSSEAFTIESGGGEISVTSMSILPQAQNSQLKTNTVKGNIEIALIEILSNSTSTIQLETGGGDISATVKGFSGVFRASTLKGHIMIPGFDNCEDELYCEGTINSSGPQTHVMEVSTQLGSIEIIFV